MREPEPPTGQLDLAFERAANGRTVLVRRHAVYPFHVTAPLDDGGAGARLVVQSASGGLYGAEAIVQRVRARPGADASLRFPSATVVHPARGRGPACQRVLLEAAEGARLRYLPRPVILFPGAHLEQSVELTVGAGARVVVCDGFMFHDPPESGEAPRSLTGRLTVRDTEGRRVAMDRMRVDAATVDAALPGTSGGYRAFGSVWAIGAFEAGLTAALRTSLEAASQGVPGLRTASSVLSRGRGMLVRIAARDGGTLDTALERIGDAAGRLIDGP